MRRLLTTIICLSFYITFFAQTGEQKDVLSIKDAMFIVSHRRCHPMVSDEEVKGMLYGVTFKMSDDKRLKVIANTHDSQFRCFLNNDLIFGKKKDIIGDSRMIYPCRNTKHT